MNPKAYEGNEPSIFISYSHANKPIAFDFITRLQKAGFRVWYDGGMEPGDDWLDILAQHLKHCGCVIALITKAFPNSKWCPRELITADNKDKTIVPIFLEPVELPDRLEFLLSSSHVVRAWEYSEDPEEFYDYVYGLKFLAPCRGGESQPTEAPAQPEPIPEPMPEPDPWTLPPAGDPADFLLTGGGTILTGYRGSGGHVVVPEGVRVIADNAFRGKTRIRALRLPEGVTEIGMGAFSDCTGLEGIVLPESLVRMGSGVFSDCTALKTVTLPPRLKILPWFAFHGCEALETVVLPRDLTAIGAQSFGSCRALTRIDLPEGLLRLDGDAFAGCISLEQVTGPRHRNPAAFAGTPAGTP